MFKSCVAIAVALLLIGAESRAAVPVRAQAAEARSRGLDLLFNLDYAEALAKFNQAIALDPADPVAHRFAASVIWMRILFEWGAILVDDYLGEAQSKVQRPAPPAGADKDFRSHISRSIELAELQLKARPKDPDAHYQVGAGYGFQASYVATVEGRVLGSIGSARRAYKEHERVLELDSTRKDAGLVVGTYQYSIAMLSMPSRVFAYFAGFGADRQRGLRLLEEAAAYPSDAQTDARFILIVVYSRERKYDQALRTIQELRKRYPRNRLLWLETGTTAMRAGRLSEAQSAFERGLAMLAADKRPRAFGEEARWHWSYGSVLVSQRKTDLADRELRIALAAAGPDWVRGRTHMEMGKIADLSGNRTRAVDAYRTAVRLCRSSHDNLGADEAARLIDKAYGSGALP